MQDNDGFEEVNLGADGSIEQPDENQPKLPKIPQRSQFFGQPLNWSKTFWGYRALVNQNQWREQAEFHRVALKEVRRALGKPCKHLIHVKSSKGISFKAKMLVKGQIKVFNVDAEAEFAHQLNAQTYKNLKDALENAVRS